MAEKNTEVPENRCGFELRPEDIDFALKWEASAFCCLRPIWKSHEDTGRCIWHADVDEKPIDELLEDRTDHPERLDGAILRDVDAGDQLSFSECGLIGAIFEDTNLQGAEFANTKLQFATFSSDTNLKKAKFPDANLKGAEFADAELLKAEFPDAILRKTKFTDTELVMATFPNAVLHKATFSDADLEGATFSDADLRWAKFPNAILVMATFANTKLKQAEFPNATLDWATFSSDTNLKGATFSDADLSEAKFSDTDLSHTDFSDAILEGAKFPSAILHKARFPNAYLAKACFSDAYLWSARFPNANLYKANFHCADLTESNFSDADLRKADFQNAKLHRSNFSDADLSHAELPAADLQEAELPDADTTGANFRDANLQDAVLMRTDCRRSTFTNALLYETVFADIRINSRTSFFESNTSRPTCVYEANPCPAEQLPEDVPPLEAARWVYRRLETLHEENAPSEAAREFHISKEEAERALYRKRFYDRDYRVSGSWIVKTFMWYITKHGESVARVLFWWGLVIATGGFLFSGLGGVKRSDGTHYAITSLAELGTITGLKEVGWNLYFSTITFSTIMDGGLAPVGPWTRAVVAGESLAGIVLTALFVFILGRRTAR